MSKDEFAEELRKKGYTVNLEEPGCVKVEGPKDIMSEIRNIAKANGFEGSFGWKLSPHCRECKCSTCTRQLTKSCTHYYESWCEICNGKENSSHRYAPKSWECDGYESRMG